MPKISILSGAYNADNYISEMIESVQGQTFSDWELIICNDGSTDNTLKICRQYELADKRIIVLDQENQGVAVARNSAFGYSRGEYIVIIDADDKILPEKLALESAILDDKREYILTYGDTWHCNKKCEHVILASAKFDKGQYSGYVYKDLCHGNFFAIHSAMFRKSGIVQLGFLYHPQRIQIEDWELWLRLSLIGKFYCHGIPVAEYRFHTTMSTKAYHNKRQVDQRSFVMNLIELSPEYQSFDNYTKANVLFNHAWYAYIWREYSTSIKYMIKSLKNHPCNIKRIIGLALVSLKFVFSKTVNVK